MGSLTQNQRSLVIGTIVGDGYVRIIPRRRNAFLEVNHSASQRMYVDWKYQMLQSIVKSEPKLRKGNGNRIACGFFTRCLPEITDLFHYFYKERRKMIPSDLSLDPLSLAVWYMDDGSRSGGSLYLNTQQFSMQDQETLQSILLNQYGIHSGLNRDKEYWRVRIVTADAQKFCNIIRSHVIPSMEYKLM